MTKIILVEDNKNTKMVIKNMIREMSKFKEKDIKIECFSKFTKELKEIINDTTEHKIYIMDIELESKVSGIDIAKYIRNCDWESEIIFLTNHDKMFELAYRNVYEVFDFIEKFHSMETRLKKDLNIIFKRNFDNKMFKYTNQNLNLQIYYRSITHIYRDKEERKIVVNTDNTNYSLILSLADTLKSLDDRFKMVHRACIVNLDRVESFNWSKGYFVLDTGEKFPMLSKKFKREVEEYYARNN